jgi:hypothetical protein
MPDLAHMKSAVELQIGHDANANQWADVVARELNGLSFAEAERELVRARRQAALRGMALVDALQTIVQERARKLDRETRTKLACSIVDLGISHTKPTSGQGSVETRSGRESNNNGEHKKLPAWLWRTPIRKVGSSEVQAAEKRLVHVRRGQDPPRPTYFGGF